jgi:hypothetical protein
MDAAFMSKVFGVVAAVLWLASAVLWQRARAWKFVRTLTHLSTIYGALRTGIAGRL